MSSSDAIYEVEKILETRKVKYPVLNGVGKSDGKYLQQRQYLIRWKGYDSGADTWEPAENLSDCIEVLEEFHKSRGEEMKKPKKKTKGSYEYVDPRSLRPKDSFWDDLQSGKVDVFATDMYSRAKRVSNAQSQDGNRPAVVPQPVDHWWSTGGSDSERSDQSPQSTQKKSAPNRTKPFVGICSETMKRATFSLTGDDVESGELTDSDNSDERKRNKKKKHRHDREHGDVSKKMKKKERREKEMRKLEKRHSSGESSEHGSAARDVPFLFEPDQIRSTGPVRPTTGIRAPRLPPAVPEVKPGALKIPKPIPKPEEKNEDETSWPVSNTVSPPCDDPSDDEMSEADLCIVEETGENTSGEMNQDLTVVDEVGDEVEREESAEKEKESEKDVKKTEEPEKEPPLHVRFPAPLKPRGQPTFEKRPPGTVTTGALVKKPRFHDPMWEELDTFPVLHSLEELEKAHNEDIKRQAVKVTLEELVEKVKLGDTWQVKYALEHDECPPLNNAEPSLVLLAAQRGFDDILEMLLSKKVDVNRSNPTGFTPLMLAAEGGYLTTTSILLTCGAHMNAVNTKGETAMIRAVKRGHTKTVKKLLDYGANFNAMVSDNKHAVALARHMNHSELDALITRHERYVESQIEEKARQSLESFGKIIARILPVHVLSFWEAEEFHIWFTGQVYPVKAGEGNLLFLSNAVFNDGEVRCQLRGECFVEKVVLNDVEQQSVTKAGKFVMSLSPLNDGNNKCTIYTRPVPHPSLRCLVTAYRIRLAR